MYRTYLGLLAALVVAVVLVGATFEKQDASTARADFAFVNGAEPKTLDPHKMTGIPEARIAEALFEGLTYRKHDNLLPEPGAAASWEASPDGRRYTFHMRKDARWSDGSPVTADDFVYSWKRLQEPEIASEYAYILHGIRHAEAYNTFAAQVKALRGDPAATDEATREGILAGLRALLARSPNGLEASAWQAFAAERGVRDVVIRPEAKVVVDGLDRRDGAFTAEEGAALLAGFEAEAARRDAAWKAAQAHFGVDEGIFAPDPSTFVVELVAFIPYFLDLTSFHAALPVPRRLVEANPESWFRKGLVGNGPFRLERWREGQSLRLVRNESYWGSVSVRLRSVEIVSTENNQTAWNLYQTGEVDWLPGNYPADLIDQLKTRPDFYATPSINVYFFRINCTRAPYTDPRVRKALARAIDRRLMVETVTRKGEPPATTIAPPGIGGSYEPPPSDLGFDPDAARRLLADAGFPDGRGFPKVAILYNTSEGHKRNAEFVANQWRTNLRIDATAFNTEWKAYLQKQTLLDYEVCRAGWNADYNDPNTMIDMWVTKGGNNNTGFGDPFYDRLVHLASDPFRLLDDPEDVLARCREKDRTRGLIDALRRSPEGEARIAAATALRFQILREAEAMLVQDAVPFIPLYFYVNTSLVAPRVKNFRNTLLLPDGTRVPNFQDMHPFRDLQVEGGR